MNTAEVVVRVVTYITALLAFGASLFVLYALNGAAAQADDDQRREVRKLRRDAWRLQLVCAVTTIFAGLVWVVIRGSTVAGVPLLQATSRSVAGEVLTATLFGRAMAWHLGLAAALIGVLVVGRHVSDDASRAVRSDMTRALLSAGMLTTLAWMGHAVGTRGFDRYVHLGSDIAHLLAAGAWLGALPLLALILLRAARLQSPALDGLAICTTRRFSPIGVICVGTLLVTGTINAWYLVGTPAALFGTAYGQLLVLKLSLFAAMLALATRNRFVLLPRVREALHSEHQEVRLAMRDIARNACIEASLGIAVIVVVGVLGLTVPGAHTERQGREHHLPLEPHTHMR